MTARELANLIGRTGVLTIQSLRVNVRVIDAREQFGRHDYLVEPLSGYGSKWVSNVTVTLDESPK